MSNPPTPIESPPRRHRTQQRDQVLAWLQATDSHPTAAEIHDALLEEMPRLSLGTVYRNLEILVDQGEVKTVPNASGALRYDGNPRPHHHFLCEACGRIQDVAIGEPRGLRRRLERECSLQARRVSINFFGFCRGCESNSGDEPSRAGRGVRTNSSG